MVLVKPGLFFTDGKMTAELVGMRERSVGPAGEMCCSKTERLVVDDVLAAVAAAAAAAAAAAVAAAEAADVFLVVLVATVVTV